MINTKIFYGYYTVEDITDFDSSYYIVGVIDLDDDGELSIGDYYGYSDQPYQFNPGESITNIDFSLSIDGKPIHIMFEKIDISQRMSTRRH